jgi:hypothetical protein
MVAVKRKAMLDRYAQGILLAVLDAASDSDAKSFRVTEETMGLLANGAADYGPGHERLFRSNPHIFQAALPKLQSILASPDFEARVAVIEYFVEEFGPQARVLLPELKATALSIYLKPENFGIVARALIEIAPDDQGVFDALVVMLNKGGRNIPEVLAKVGPHHRQAAIDQLVVAAASNNDTYDHTLEALAGFGPDAKRVEPALLTIARACKTERARYGALDTIISIDEQSVELHKTICDAAKIPCPPFKMAPGENSGYDYLSQHPSLAKMLKTCDETARETMEIGTKPVH